MDLMNDLKQIFINQFEKYGIAYTNTEDIHKLARGYLNIRSKIIKPTPRNVFISEELRSKNMPDEINAIFDEIKTKFEEGSNINPHLSKKLFNPDYDDRLLHSWKIYHLHLSNTKQNESDFFFDRSDFLLFCMVRESEVYFIEILPHRLQNVFSKREMLKILKNNWPWILEPCKVQGIERGATYNDEEIGQLRKYGINSLIEIDGDVYIPIGGGGLSLAGTNTKHSVAVESLIKTIREVEKQIINNEVSIREEIAKTVPDLPDNLDFHLFLEEYGFVIKEINTEKYIFWITLNI